MTVVPPSAVDELTLLAGKVTADPGDRDSRVRLARLHLLRADLDAALPLWQEADAIRAADEPERMDRLTLLLKGGHLPKAAELVEAHAWTTADAYRMVARRAFDDDDYERAERVARAGTDLFPDDVETRYVLAHTAYFGGRLDETVAECRKIVELAPKHQNALRIWAHALSDLRKLRAAALKFQEAYDVDPSLAGTNQPMQALFFTFWGGVLRELKRFDEALPLLRRAAELDPQDDEVRNAIADTYSDLDRWYDAMAAARDLLQHNPEAPTALVTLLFSQVRAGLTTEATETLKKLSHLLGVDQLDLMMKALIAWDDCRYGEARRLAASVRAKYYANRVSVLDGMADLALLILQDLDTAEQMLDDALALVAPWDELKAVANRIFRARLLLARAEMTAPHKRQERVSLRSAAFAECRAAILRIQDGIAEDRGRAASEAELSYLLQALLLTEAPMAEVQAHLDAALRLPARRSETNAAIGTLQMKQKNYAAAILSLENATSASPRDVEHRLLLADALLRAGDLDRAEAEIRDILSRAAENVDARMLLGRLYIELGEKGDVDSYAQAVAELTAAQHIDGTIGASKKMTPRELSTLQYLRGFARTKMYDEQKTFKDESLLVAAAQDFQDCSLNDPDNHRAASAKRKVHERLNPKTGGWISDRIAGAVCMLMSLSIFGTAGYRFADGLLSPGYAAVLMFGSLLFVIASFYLPQLLKLKVGSVELEKAALDSALARVPLQIRKAAFG